MRFRDFHKNVKIRIIDIFTSRFVVNMIFSFMTIYFAHHFGEKNTGLLLLINVFIGLAMSLLGGYLSDQFGRKRIMLIDVSTPEQRKLMYSITYWATNFSIAAGGILGALLFQDYLFELFIVLCLAELFVVILVAFFISETVSSANENGGHVRVRNHVARLLSGYNRVLKDKLFVFFVLASVLVYSMEQQLTNYIGIRLSDQMPAQHLFFWPVNGLTMLGLLRSENTLLVLTDNKDV
ncbi:MAG: hypothetical protein ACE3JK_11530 [Sporolactobacillus sp.]